MKRWAEDLAMAIAEGNAAAALLMLRCGFPPNTQMRAIGCGEEVGGKTYCAHLAAQKGLISILRFLSDSPEALELRNSSGSTPFLIACKFGEFEAIRFLALSGKVDTSAVDTQGNNAVHLAAAAAHKDIVQYLVEELNISPCVKNVNGELPVDVCARVALTADCNAQATLEAISLYLKSKYSAPLVIDTSPKLRKLSQQPRSRISLTPLARVSTGNGVVRLNLRSATPIDRLIHDRCKIVFTTVQNKRVQPLRRGAIFTAEKSLFPGTLQS